MKKSNKHGIVVWIFMILSGIFLMLFPKIKQYCKEKHMETTAIDYIREKYGIEASLKALYYYTKEQAVVHLKDGDKYFVVFIDSQNKISDTYQNDEIKAAFIEHIAEVYPDWQYYDMEIWQPIKEEYRNREFSLDQNTRFDGANLDDLLQDCNIDLTIYYVDTEFTDCALFKELQDKNMKGAFVSFDTKEHLEEYGNSILPVVHEEHTEYYASNIYFAPHITHIWKIDKESNSETSYPLQAGDGFFYCCPAASVSFEESNAEILAYNYCGGKSEEAEPILESIASRAFTFYGTNWDDIYVYIPISEIPDYESLSALWFAFNTGQSVNGIKPLSRFGDYAVFTLTAGRDPSWMLIKQAET